MPLRSFSNTRSRSPATPPTPEAKLAQENRRAGRLTVLSGLLALVDFAILLFLSTVYYGIQTRGGDQIIYGFQRDMVENLKYIVMALLPLFFGAVGLWVAVRSRDRSARALTWLIAGLHLMVVPAGTILGLLALMSLPPRLWNWQMASVVDSPPNKSLG